MRNQRSSARRNGPIRGAFSALVLVSAPLFLAVFFAPAALAEQARGIDEAFFAPGGALDERLPAELATAPAPAAGAASGNGAPSGVGASPGVGDDVVAEATVAAGATSPASVDAIESPGIPLDGGDLAYSGARLFVGLGVVIALIYAINAFLRRSGTPLAAGSGLVRRLAMETLGPNQIINIVEVSGKVIVIGVTDKGMTMLTELQGEAADRARLAHSRAASGSEGAAGRGSFGGALRQFTGNLFGGRLDPRSSSAPGMERAAFLPEAYPAGPHRDTLVPNDALAPSDALAPRPRGRARAGGASATGSGAANWTPPHRRSAAMAGAGERGAAGLDSSAEPGDRRRRLDERASAFLAQQQDLIRGLNL